MKTMMRAEPAGRPATRLTQGVWLALAALSSAVWFGGPLSQWTALQTICHPDSACRQFQLDPTAAGTLSLHGVSLAAYAALLIVIWVALWVLWYGVSGVIMWRRPNDRGAILGAYFLVLLPMWSAGTWIQLDVLNSVIFVVFATVLFLFGLLFPDGRFQPPWTRWLAVSIVAFLVLVNLPLPAALSGLLLAMTVGVFFAVVGVQIYRYRAISSWTQRQQTKWAVSGLAAGILGLLGTWLAESIAPVPSGNGSLLLAVMNSVGIATVLSVIPLSMGIAILRSRLWDIDHVINRALVYSSLTLILAGIYIGGVLGLEALFRAVFGGSSTLAIALSTLAIVVLFGPVRRTVQTWIDRRFYRSKYDAQQTLSEFAERVRDEVDLTRLSEGLLTVVRETLQPQHVSLWLEDAGRGTQEDERSPPAGALPQSHSPY